MLPREFLSGKSHPDWVLYDQDIIRFLLENEYLGIMNRVGWGASGEVKICKRVRLRFDAIYLFDGFAMISTGDRKKRL
jgi:hypothetical protein